MKIRFILFVVATILAMTSALGQDSQSSSSAKTKYERFINRKGITVTSESFDVGEVGTDLSHVTVYAGLSYNADVPEERVKCLYVWVMGDGVGVSYVDYDEIGPLLRAIGRMRRTSSNQIRQFATRGELTVGSMPGGDQPFFFDARGLQRGRLELDSSEFRSLEAMIDSAATLLKDK